MEIETNMEKSSAAFGTISPLFETNSWLNSQIGKQEPATVLDLVWKWFLTQRPLISDLPAVLVDMEPGLWFDSQQDLVLSRLPYFPPNLVNVLLISAGDSDRLRQYDRVSYTLKESLLSVKPY